MAFREILNHTQQFKYVKVVEYMGHFIAQDENIGCLIVNYFTS